jgi:hypothetical protein
MMLNQEEEITPKNVIDLVIKECKRVIVNISKKHNIDCDELLDDNLPEKIRLHNLLIKRKNRRNLPMTEMCMGRKLDMQQCTRRRLEGTEFCASHTKKLKMGRIDEPFPSEMIKGKRGRRKKQIVNVEQRDCIPAYVEVINRQKFLIDNYSRVFYYNETNPQDTCYIGALKLDGTIDFDKNYLTYYADKYKVNTTFEGIDEEQLVKSIDDMEAFQFDDEQAPMDYDFKLLEDDEYNDDYDEHDDEYEDEYEDEYDDGINNLENNTNIDMDDNDHIRNNINDNNKDIDNDITNKKMKLKVTEILSKKQKKQKDIKNKKKN